MYKNISNEKDYQRYIIDYLVSTNGYEERKAASYHKGFAMDTELFFRFLEFTQGASLAKLDKIYNGATRDTILSVVNQAVTQKGSSLIETLKAGVDISGVHLDLLYGKPAMGITQALVNRYNANILSVMEEVWINDTQRIDSVIFVNGFAVMAFELKCENSGQDYRNAVYQYSNERDAKNRLFLFKAGVLVCFAMDLNNCYMTTKLDGVNTRFIPFNRGRGKGVRAGAGNPIKDGVDDWPTHYIWDDLLTRDSMIELLTKFVFVQRKEVVDETTGKKVLKEAVVFPRYHQRDAIHCILADVQENRTAGNYLIEHSAGSGKSNTIAWTAHRLASLHDANDNIIFDNIVIVTDRVVVDRQLQNAVKSIDHKTGLIRTIGDKETSNDLADALKGNTKIIVSTIQKFPFIVDVMRGLSDKKFAVIIDEAHSSTAGKDMGALSIVLGSDEDAELLSAEDMIYAEVVKHGKQQNVSVFAFTATPKPTTIALFGRETVTLDGLVEKGPFHIYSMKQAIEEGFILDALENYIEYKTYYRISKAVEDDPELNTAKAKREIARFVDMDSENIGQRVSIIIEHFRNVVMREVGPWAKAMVVTASREAAIRYRQAFEDYVTRHGYSDVKALVAFSGKVKLDGDGTEYTEAKMNGFPEDKLPKQFDGDVYNVLLVANKYQVGFDQPKLCAMYVLKRLKGVNAVQTLSRLNRPCPPFDKKVFVMDFVNSCDEMEKAFAPFYTTTVLSNTVTVAQMREKEIKIDGYDILDDRDIETVCEVVFNPAGRKATTKDDRRVEQCIQRCLRTLRNQYDADGQREFQADCRGFVRLYEFMSLASSFGDSELHKKYTFIRILLTHLTTGNNGGISIKDKIKAENFVQENLGDKGKKGAHASAPVLKLPGVDVSLTRDEQSLLSEIIAEVNARAGKDFDQDVMAKALLQIKGLLMKSEKLKTSAKNNTEKDFEFSFYGDTDEALLDGLEQNQDLFTLLLNNEDVKRSVLGVFLHDVYETLRGQE